ERHRILPRNLVLIAAARRSSRPEWIDARRQQAFRQRSVVRSGVERRIHEHTTKRGAHLQSTALRTVATGVQGWYASPRNDCQTPGPVPGRLRRTATIWEGGRIVRRIPSRDAAAAATTSAPATATWPARTRAAIKLRALAPRK